MMPKSEEILNLSQGAMWRKADLHIHTPASSDTGDKWKKASPQDIVRISTEKQLDIIAITDHNTAAWCDAVREAAVSTNLTVFPGVEISTHQGHILGIFDITKPASDIEDLLITLQIPRTQFGSLEAATPQSVAEVCEAIEQAGGVAIAAHVDGERGFMNVIKVGNERKRAYAATCLRGLEVVDASLRNDYQSGSKSGYRRRLACIQSSDCRAKGTSQHQLDSIAGRYSLLKMDEQSLSGLKLALIDPEMRVRLQNDVWPSTENAIVGMWVTGGFLNGQQFRFNEHVNCFIGDTGSGKSVAIELIRFGLDQTPRVQKIQQEVESLLREQLGNLGTVHILLKKGDTYYLVERTWGEPPAQPSIQRLSPTGIEQIEGGFDTQLFFPIKAFSQSEIIEFAREPQVRLSLTDDLIDSTTENTAIKDLKVSLRENAASICAEQSKEDNIRQELNELPRLIEAREQIDKILNDPRINQHQQWYKEQTLIEQAEQQFNKLTKALEPATSTVRVSISLPPELTTLPNSDLIEELKGIYEEWQKQVNALQKGLTESLNALLEKLGGLKGRWNTRFTKAEEEYHRLLAEIDKNGIGLGALSERRQALEAQISTLEERKKELDSKVMPYIKELREKREDLLTQLQNNRKAITAKREAKAKELSEKLEDRIRLSVHSRANTTAFRDKLQQIQQGARLHGVDLDLLAKCHPISLVKGLLSQDFQNLSDQSEVEQSKLAKLWDTILERNRLDELYELQLVDVEDIIEVMLRVEKGEYKAIEALAHGQKCMVVLMVALAEGDFPLIVDQPEDIFEFQNLNEYHLYKSAIDYETLKSGLGEYVKKIEDRRTKSVRTLEGEFLRSMQEVQIANCLYLNGIDYVYEKPYPHPIQGARKQYTPDFYISQGENEAYIEHYALTENMQSFIFTPQQVSKYRKGIKDKRSLHLKNNTNLIETWSYHNDKRPLVEHLKEMLVDNGFVLKPRNLDEVYKKIVDTGKDKYIYRLVWFTMRFIEQYKTAGYDESGFNVLRSKTDNVRNRLYLDIAEDVYLHYQKILGERNEIDFADMINDANFYLAEMQKQGIHLPFKYIVIDEFQDIARQRFNLTKRLSEITGAKVVAVGDDWQSIYAFAGSDITLFKRFTELMGSGVELLITHTYRNSQELIDIAGDFIQKNFAQIKKRLVSTKRLKDPIRLKFYDDRTQTYKNLAKSINESIGSIIREFGENTSVLLLGRYNFDLNKLQTSGEFEAYPDSNKVKSNKFPKANIYFLTVHSSKGLGYDNVIILNMLESRYGFPSQIETDPIIKMVTFEDISMPFAEERRLFYVALTRTKNQVHIASPLYRPSRFLIELINEYNLPYPKDMNLDIPNLFSLKCPICGFPLRYEYNKNYGLRVYICTNETEICDFMTNDRKELRDIFICPDCKDGYMIVKRSKEYKGAFYGCTNYDGTGEGCNKIIRYN